LAPHLDSQNATELFTACCRKTRRQVDELLAARFPRPDVREQIRRLPTRTPVQAPVIADEPEIETHDDAVVEPKAASQGSEATFAELPRFTGNNGSEPALPVVGLPPARHRELEALSSDRFGVHFTADAELKELLERARALASHRLPKNDLSGLMRLVLASFVKHEEARRFAVGRKPRRTKADATQAKAPSPRATPPGGVGSAIASPEDNSELVRPRGSQVAWVAAGFAKQSKRSRHVPAAVRREVYLRDRGQCSFVSEDGRRCEARAALELDHVEPWAKLGDAQVDNIRLRCRAHNQLHARECFGGRHIEAKITARQAQAVVSSGEI
jgi:5-methylcytosine-specific restriction endonuclease McrA